MDTHNKATAAIVAALLVIVTPASYALAQNQIDPVRTIVVQPGQQLLSQKTKLGALESIGCSNNDFWAVYNAPENKGKIGFTCVGLDTSEPLEDPTTGANGSSHYNAAVSCRSIRVEVREGVSLVVPQCTPKLQSEIDELSAVNEALKAQIASANGRAEAESKRADDNRASAQTADARAKAEQNASQAFMKKVLFFGALILATLICGFIVTGTMFRRLFKRLDERAPTIDIKAIGAEFTRAVEPKFVAIMNTGLEQAAGPILKEITDTVVKEQTLVAKERAQIQSMSDQVASGTSALREGQRKLADDRGTLDKDRAAFESRRNDLFTLATRDGFEEGRRVWTVEARKLADDQAVYQLDVAAAEAEQLAAVTKLMDKEAELTAREAELDAKEQELAKREAAAAQPIRVNAPIGPVTSRFPAVTTNASASGEGRPVSIRRPTMPVDAAIGTGNHEPIPRQSNPPSFGPDAEVPDESAAEAADDPATTSNWWDIAPAEGGNGVVTHTDIFEPVDPTFRPGDGRFICNICELALEIGTQKEHHRHFTCSECPDQEVMSETELKIHVLDKHPELMATHGSDRAIADEVAASAEPAVPGVTTANYRVLPPDHGSIPDSEFLMCNLCFEQVDPDKDGEHVHVECLLCRPPVIMLEAEIKEHLAADHPDAKKDA